MISELQSTVSQTNANLIQATKQATELKAHTKDYQHYKLISEDLSAENKEIKPKLNELLEFKSEVEKS